MLFLILRFLLKRQSGVIGIADLLVVVLIVDAAQNAMASEYKSITESAILVLTIVFWNYAVDWLGFRFPALAVAHTAAAAPADQERRDALPKHAPGDDHDRGTEQPTSPTGGRALLRGEKGLHRRRLEDQHHPERQWRTRSEEYPVEGNDLGCVQPYLYSGGFQA